MPGALYARCNTDSLTALEIRLITASYELVSPGRRFAQKFYARLFEQAPEIRALFPDDLTLQVTKLTDMLAALVETLDRPAELAKRLQALGERHRGYGIDARHFAPVGRALFETLESEIGPRFDGATRRAWIALYSLATSWMQPPSGDHEALW
jgi:nitric oxide dioxygenase